MNNKGETLIELIVSLALLALLVTMMATSFQASNKSLYNNIVTKRDINTQIRQLTLEESIEQFETLNIQYHYVVGGVSYTDSFATEVVKPVSGSLYKFR